MRYTLGFVGIGLMGRPMTLRLLDAGFTVRVWNRSPEKLSDVAAAGAAVCASVAELVANSDVILLCLADSAAVESVVAQGVIAAGNAQKLLIDLSSIHPDVTRRLAAAVKAGCGMRWVDAPVSGGTVGAEEGSLAIMAGGEADDIDVARQVLRPLYSRLTHMGPVGSGQITKICNQMIVSCNVLVIAEMMALARAAGVDAERIPQALAGGFADSKPLQIVGPEMAENRFEPVKWRVGTLLKDLTMAADIAGQAGSAVPMSGLAAQLLRLHAGRGFLNQDPATLIKLYRET
ncbi:MULTISPECIES: NAD(P)-dependent oxidoreductase [Methylomonas]|uniref:2-hydroxy-3-oxopropionate reductase n=1 Tax=Methylomonas koyamae TaxID=702114 RepID=A0A177MZY1_9GAMM|nr:NAD(P)-dependent oxidoreductase [Methylomonas koyamae]OAI11165.1 2-hydroxy-3-oxopropionate reductase [Methylomonas koyamae]